MLNERLPNEYNASEAYAHRREVFPESDFIQVPSRVDEKIDEADLSKEIDSLFSNLEFDEVG
ncbi:hypothetical protein F9L33_02385 [Amylibacter sp. SFDW26]|uniref:hypothetical protein n=1 Tax=Amylibacter sp. SFDW26 TaxID=2652722 RepID=UPI0012617B67|nr:hypothetical protein [Amylibacter sp. SFDW26]KAB7615629.1 hypothetical protein F9L33_02385 [Amylibacter sp. SFDW26]